MISRPQASSRQQLRGTEPATATPRPSPRAAGTPRTQMRQSAWRSSKPQRRPTGHRAGLDQLSDRHGLQAQHNDQRHHPSVRRRRAASPSGSVPQSIRSRIRPRCRPGRPGATHGCRVPGRRPPAGRRPGGNPAVRASQPTSATATANGSTASGAMIMARAAVRRSISVIVPDGTMVSVPTESRSASSMIGAADYVP